MKGALVKLDDTTPEIPKVWSYGESVERTKGNLYKWGNITDEILSELWIARELLSRKRHPGKMNVANATFKTWEGYCEAIGLDRTVAHRWLKRYEQKELDEPEGAEETEGAEDVGLTEDEEVATGGTDAVVPGVLVPKHTGVYPVTVARSIGDIIYSQLERIEHDDPERIDVLTELYNHLGKIIKGEL